MTRFVLDASALLALLRGEPGAEEVAAATQAAMISAVNLSEVLARLLEVGLPEREAWETATAGNLEVVLFDGAQARGAAELKARTRELGLSLGDRACLALGRARRLPVLTADRTWARLKVGVEIRVIR